MDRDIPNFDTLVQIARSDPELLERIRQHLSNSTINSAPGHLRPRLRGLQFQIDSRRLLAKTPLAACIEISEMLQQSFEELRQVLNEPTLSYETTANRPTARIIPFPRNHSASSRHTS